MSWFKSKEESELIEQEKALALAEKKAQMQSQILEKLRERLDIELQCARDRIDAQTVREQIKNPDAVVKRQMEIEDERQKEETDKEKRKERRKY